jgi:hypothetical protein
MFQAEETQWVETQEHMAQCVTLIAHSYLTNYEAGSNVYTPLEQEQEVEVEAHVNRINITKSNSKESFLPVTFAIDVVSADTGSTTVRQTTTQILTRSVFVGRQAFREVCWSQWRNRQKAADR